MGDVEVPACILTNVLNPFSGCGVDPEPLSCSFWTELPNDCLDGCSTGELDVVDTLTDAICNIPPAPENPFEDLFNLIPGCADNCQLDLDPTDVAGVCDSLTLQQGCLEEQCSQEDLDVVFEVTDQFCELAGDGSPIEDLLELIPSCAIDCQSLVDVDPTDVAGVCDALGDSASCFEEQCTEPDLGIVIGVTDQVCQLVDDNPIDGITCGIDCFAEFLGGDPLDLCGTASSAEQCAKDASCDGATLDLFAGITETACDLPIPGEDEFPLCALECVDFIDGGSYGEESRRFLQEGSNSSYGDGGMDLPLLPDLPFCQSGNGSEVDCSKYEAEYENMCEVDCDESGEVCAVDVCPECGCIPVEEVACEITSELEECLEGSCGESDPLTQFAEQLREFACSIEIPDLPDSPIDELPDLSCAFECAPDLESATDPQEVCELLDASIECIAQTCDLEDVLEPAIDFLECDQIEIPEIPEIPELPDLSCAVECVPELEFVTDPEELCALLEESIECVQIACDSSIDLDVVLETLNCDGSISEPPTPEPTSSPTLPGVPAEPVKEELDITLTGDSLEEFDLTAFEEALSEITGADVKVESVTLKTLVTLEGEFGGQFTNAQQTQCREQYAEDTGVSIELVVILSFSFGDDGRRLQNDSEELSVEFEVSSLNPNEVDGVLGFDAEAYANTLDQSDDFTVTGANQAVEQVAPRVELSSSSGADTENLGEQLADNLDFADGAEFTPINNDNGSSSDNNDEVIIIAVCAVAGVALLAGGAAFMIFSKRHGQKEIAKSAEMKGSKSEPKDMF